MKQMTKKWMYTFALLLSAALLATACGGGGKSDTPAAPAASPDEAANAGGDAKAITIVATNFDFEPREIRVKQGETLAITLENKQGLHGVEFKGYNKEVKGKETVTFTADKAGEFDFVCSIMCGAGHNDMVGKLIVE